uniref:Uncharacterized protein n=1 Tax=Rhizophagus irregularis (strain DAOM 181602 / DAOM 197198 / MUCL 43194) TaxID=747089 RepID=U9U676_RHIID
MLKEYEAATLIISGIISSDATFFKSVIMIKDRDAGSIVYILMPNVHFCFSDLLLKIVCLILAFKRVGIWWLIDEMANRILDFFNDNKVVDEVDVEDFQNFDISINLYRSVIELALLCDKYNNNYNDDDDNDDDGESSKREKRSLKELKSVMISTLRASSILKISKRFILLLVNARNMVWKLQSSTYFLEIIG